MHYKIYIIAYLIHIGIIRRFRYERKRHHLSYRKDCYH
jgi:hypothetical protein